MRKVITTALMLLIVTAFFTAAWAGWYGTVYCLHGRAGYADVTTSIQNEGQTTANAQGDYCLDEHRGMVQGHYYSYLRGYKSCCGDGYNYVASYYDRDVTKTGLNIYLDTAGK